MASQLGSWAHAAWSSRSRGTGQCAAACPLVRARHLKLTRLGGSVAGVGCRAGWRVRASSSGGDSYLDMWKRAVDRDRKSAEFQKIAERSEGGREVGSDGLEKKRNQEFRRILEVPREERDRAQRMQVIDRADAAIAAVRALIDENAASESPKESGDGALKHEKREKERSISVQVPVTSGSGSPGPDFWSWTPPSHEHKRADEQDLMKLKKPSSSGRPFDPVMEKERYIDFVSIPFESKTPSPSLPPLQSLMEIEIESPAYTTSPKTSSLKEDHELGSLSKVHAAEAADALDKVDVLSSEGVNLDGSRWWKETGIEKRPDGVHCWWTMTRGVSADRVTEWQEKFWEAADELGYKELGSEKAGRDAHGNVWHEYWRESMRQESGLVHLEKTADKWGKNGKGDEWQETWWEHYDASGKAEKWAHKWCSIDPTMQLEAGHAHIWHERWGEKYDGHGGSVKYTDKWAERCEDDKWSKWGDKWDENFDPNGHGVKQGETWWQGPHGERWNRTWGERHNGSGWVHKYGKSSSGEHWDTHVKEETWYERFPHYGFYHCFENSVKLREVRKPSEML